MSGLNFTRLKLLRANHVVFDPLTGSGVGRTGQNKECSEHPEPMDLLVDEIPTVYPTLSISAG